MREPLSVDLDQPPGPRCSAPSYFFDSDAPALAAFARATAGDAATPTEKAVRLYYAVRDRIRYDPAFCNLSREQFRAGAVLAQGRGFCIPKALLLATLARAQGIPAALGLADVRNHLSTPEMLEGMDTDRFFHGYTVMSLEGKWVKVSPAFNLSMCERFRVLPLEWDGKQDALLHPYDALDRRHMEYLADHGVVWDLPYERVMATLWERFPGYMARLAQGEGGRFQPSRASTATADPAPFFPPGGA